MNLNFFSKTGPPADKRTAWLQLDDYSAYPVAGPCTIGRSKTNTIAIRDEKISRLHALVHVQDRGEHWLVDLGSSNGTYLNGTRVVQPSQLKDQDLIQIGEHTLHFFLKAAPEAETGDDALEEAQITVQETKEVPCWLLVADIENFVGLGGKKTPDELARLVGEWLAACHHLILKHQGTISHYVGDGFTAYWDGRKVPAGDVAECLEGLKKLQNGSQLPFRLAIHFGKAVLRGSPFMGSAGMFGHDINFVFRMERLAKLLSVSCILSEAAFEAFSRPASVKPMGSYSLSGFDGAFMFYKA